MNKGSLSFSLNGKFMGVAYQTNNLKKGPVYPAVALSNQAGFKTVNNKPIPELFKEL